jgi:MFS superfamily sulfate permease-like transporter
MNLSISQQIISAIMIAIACAALLYALGAFRIGKKEERRNP